MSQRQGMLVNHERVARLMREDNLVGTELQHCRRELTEPGDHGEIYVKLANRLKLTGPNQVWVADITFVRLKCEFDYLAVVLDKFSRKVVGWNLARTLTARLPLGALEMALEGRPPGLGLVHHSDRGAQYAHAEYLSTLRNHE
jgi:putative transposase